MTEIAEMENNIQKNKQIKSLIEDAQMILIGIGEEFSAEKILKQDKEYLKEKEKLLQDGRQWEFPFLQRMYQKKLRAPVEMQERQLEERKIQEGQKPQESAAQSIYEREKAALQGLAELLQDKNYFVVSTLTNDLLIDCGFKADRVVLPCGGSRKVQCPDGCEGSLHILSDEVLKSMEEVQNASKDQVRQLTEVCPVCGKPLIFNNIYAEHYDEKGYLDQWQVYTKWLQGTLNRKMLVLELGAGMQYPGVIRFPFEKAAYFNQKAHFVRVNGYLYQLTEELREKGISVPKNAAEWLLSFTRSCDKLEK